MSISETLASDAERERVSERLRTAVAEGRLTTEELSERLERTFAARTHAELDGVVAGLPGVPAPVERRRPAVRRKLERQGIYLAAPVLVCILVWAFSGAHGGFWPKWVIFAALVRLLFGAREHVLGTSRRGRRSS